jgi:hypothetical protein
MTREVKCDGVAVGFGETRLSVLLFQAARRVVGRSPGFYATGPRQSVKGIPIST